MTSLKYAAGFTLTELMVAAVVSALLLAVAYPVYTEQMRGMRRGDAIHSLLLLANRLATHRANHQTYTVMSVDSEDGHYSLVVTAGGDGIAGSYVLTATPKAGTDQVNDKCGSLTLNHRGVQGMVDADAGVTVEDCW